MIYIVTIVFAFPLLSLLPFAEPYVLGLQTMFHMGCVLASIFVIVKIFTGKNKLYFPCSDLHILMYIYIIYTLVNNIFNNNIIQVLNPLSWTFFIVLLIVLSDGKFSIKNSLRVPLVFLFFYLIIEIVRKDFLFGHSHFFGSYIILVLPMLFFHFIHEKDMRFRFLNIAVVFGSAYFILIKSQSVILILILLFTVIVTLGFRFYYHRKFLTVLLIGLLFGAIIGLFNESISRSFEDRLIIWKTIIMHFKAIPFFGVGFQGFENYFQNLLHGELIGNSYDSVLGRSLGVEWCHNEILQNIVELGYLGGALICSVFLLIFRKIIEFYNKKDDRFILYSGLINIIIYSFFSFPLRMPSTGILFFLLFFFFSLEGEEKKIIVLKFPPLKNSNHIISQMLIIISCVSIVLGAREILSLGYFSLGLEPKYSKSLKTQYLEKSVNLWPESKLYNFALAKDYLDKGDFYRAEYYFQQSYVCAPTIPALFGLALSKELNNKNEQAFDLYERIKKIYPDFIPAQHNLETLKKKLTWSADNESFKLTKRILVK